MIEQITEPGIVQGLGMCVIAVLLVVIMFIEFFGDDDDYWY